VSLRDKSHLPDSAKAGGIPDRMKISDKIYRVTGICFSSPGGIENIGRKALKVKFP